MATPQPFTIRGATGSALRGGDALRGQIQQQQVTPVVVQDVGVERRDRQAVTLQDGPPREVVG